MNKNTMSIDSLLSSPEELVSHIASLDDRELVARISGLVARERSATAALVAHLAEMDRRKLYLELGYSSLFTYCTQALHFSEQGAYKRMEAARAARRFPLLLARLAEGALHLSAVVLLAPVLSKENHRALIDEARHKSKREVEVIVARVRPSEPVPSLIRKIPARAEQCSSDAFPAMPPAASLVAPSVDPLVASPIAQSVAQQVAQPVALPVAAPALAHAAPASSPPTSLPGKRPIIAPLAPGSYKVQFSAGTEMHERLMRAQALLRHQIPDGDIAKVLDLALIALLEKTEARKIGRRTHRHAVRRRKRMAGGEAHETRKPESNVGTARPPAEPPVAESERRRSRHIPAEVRRVVWERDQGRCAFTSAGGVRCTEKSFLEFDHREPYACGGPTTADNLRLLCRRHNQYWARLRFGRKGEQAREQSPRSLEKAGAGSSYSSFHTPLLL
jgi:5-methylcytosine-specific restriction endonuclease McrA